MDINKQFEELKRILTKELQTEVEIIRKKSKNEDAEKIMDEIIRLLTKLSDKIKVKDGDLLYPPEIAKEKIEAVPVLRVGNTQIYGVPTDINFSILLEAIVNEKKEESKGDIILIINNNCQECYEEYRLLLKEFPDFTIHVFNIRQFPTIPRLFPFTKLPAAYVYVNNELKIAWSGKNDEKSIEARKKKLFE